MVVAKKKRGRPKKPGPKKKFIPLTLNAFAKETRASLAGISDTIGRIHLGTAIQKSVFERMNTLERVYACAKAVVETGEIGKLGYTPLALALERAVESISTCETIIPTENGVT